MFPKDQVEQIQLHTALNQTWASKGWKMLGWYRFHPKPWLRGQRHEHQTSPSFFTVMVATVDNNNRWQYNRKKKMERGREEEATPNNSVATVYPFLPIMNVVLFLPDFPLPTNTGHLILSLLSLSYLLLSSAYFCSLSLFPPFPYWISFPAKHTRTYPMYSKNVVQNMSQYLRGSRTSRRKL